MDKALLKYNWTPEEDVTLSNTVLRYIAEGLTMKDAFAEVSRLLYGERTADACENRWNTALKKRVRSKLDKARTIRAIVRKAKKEGHQVEIEQIEGAPFVNYSFLTDEIEYPEIPVSDDTEPQPTQGLSVGPRISWIGTETGRLSGSGERTANAPKSVDQETDQEELSEAGKLYRNMVNAIDAVIEHGLNNQPNPELEKELAAAKQENEMLWQRVGELEEIERKYNSILSAIGHTA